jgi:hypothetical protein
MKCALLLTLLVSTNAADAASCDRTGQDPYKPGDCVLNGSPDKTNCNCTHFNLDLYLKGSDGKYTTHTKSCVIGNNLNWMSKNDTVASCQTACDNDSNCKSIEFGVAYGGGGKGTKSSGDCSAPTPSPAFSAAGHIVPSAVAFVFATAVSMLV